MLLYLGAAALVAGMAVALALVLARSDQTATVAHSLALIQQGVRPHEAPKNEQSAADRLVKPFFAWTRRLALALSPKGTAARLTKLLDMAGNPRDWGAERVLAIKGSLLLLGAVIGLLFGKISLVGVLLAAALGAFCFYLPDILLYNTGLKRQDELRRGLADAMDMLTVCVEAGQGFDAALLQVSRSVTGPVAGEFTRVVQEISIGKPRGAAFNSLASRTNIDEIKTFVTAIVQADRLGVPVGNVLREQADQMRLIRRQKAEETAQKVPIKILFPMLLCIFPALMIVVVGPGAVRMIGVFGNI